MEHADANAADTQDFETADSETADFEPRFATIDSAIEALRNGRMVIVVDDEDRARLARPRPRT